MGEPGTHFSCVTPTKFAQIRAGRGTSPSSSSAAECSASKAPEAESWLGGGSEKKRGGKKAWGMDANRKEAKGGLTRGTTRTATIGKAAG